MESSAVTKQQLINALQAACNDYAGVMLYSSKIHIHMQLSTKDMWCGLCIYFSRRYSWFGANLIDELSHDFGNDLRAVSLCSMPNELETTAEIKTKALAPRLELLHKTLSRLQKELNQHHA